MSKKMGTIDVRVSSHLRDLGACGGERGTFQFFFVFGYVTPSQSSFLCRPFLLILDDRTHNRRSHGHAHILALSLLLSLSLSSLSLSLSHSHALSRSLILVRFRHFREFSNHETTTETLTA